MTEHKVCIFCNSPKLVNLTGYEKAYINQCQSCGLVFSKNAPSQEDLLKFYSNYGEGNYLSPLTIKRYNELLDQFETYRKTNRILDIGCGKGYFLEEAKKRGWDVFGNEISAFAISKCSEKNIKMSEGALNANSYPAEYFDVITSFEVIEHINNPQSEIATINKILRKGGLVYLTTPNFNSMLRYYLKSKYNIITYPEHLTYYTPKTIEHVFTTNQFKKVNIKTTGLSLTRLRMSKGKSEQKIASEKSDDEKIRVQIDNKLYLQLSKKIINTILTIFGIGDSLKAWFIKI
jgi:2-polyprenyl-3-methyl-5-hydroxy-6-metoxy-1,4-benzoquinol methylase